MLPPVALGAGNVARLALLVASAEQQDDSSPPPSTIDSVPGAVVNAELQDTLAHWLAVACSP